MKELVRRFVLGGCTLLLAINAFSASAAVNKVLISTGAEWKYLDDGSDQSPTSLRTFDPFGFSEIPFLFLEAFGMAANPEETSVGDFLEESGILPELKKTGPTQIAETFFNEFSDMSVLDFLNSFGFPYEQFLRSFELYPVWEESGAREILGSARVGALLEEAGIDKNIFIQALKDAGVYEPLAAISLGSVLDQTPAEELLHDISLGTLFASFPSWRRADFDDAAWKSGKAQLGYGDDDETTKVESGPANSKFITTYFRHKFTVDSLEGIQSLKLRVLRDDGVAVYLNNVEVARDNLPTDHIAADSLATKSVEGSAENEFIRFAIPAEILAVGENILAVEIHQSSPSSSDISFDLELVGTDVPGLSRGPYLQSGRSTGVIVRWRTDTAASGVVRFGLTPENLDQAVTNTVITTEQEVELSGLTPNTTYYYAVATPAAILENEGLQFTTAPVAGTDKKTRVWIIGDAGTANTNAFAVRDAYYNYAANDHTDVWLMLGDNAYESGTDKEFQKAVFETYPSLLKNTFMYSTIGNHETAQSANPSPNIPYYLIHSFFTNAQGGGVASGTEDYYSFDYANIHFVCLDSMTEDRSTNGPMANWLAADLEATQMDWIIAYFHHPPYTKGSHDSDNGSGADPELVEMRENILPILEAHGVDMVFSGHSHCYERSFLVDGHYGYSDTFSTNMMKNAGSGKEVDPQGAYIKAGPSGTANEGAVYIVAGSSGKISGGSLNHPVMFMSLNRLGSMVLDVEGGRLEARFLNSVGIIEDEFVMLKNTSSNLPPAVQLTKPAADAVFPSFSDITMRATATDADGIVKRVQFLADGQIIGVDTEAPYEFIWQDVLEGTYQVQVVAVDELQKEGSSEVVTLRLVPTIEKIIRTAERIEVYFTAKAGESYIVEFTDAINGAWKVLTEIDPQPQHSKIVVVDLIDKSHRFFRLRKPGPTAPPPPPPQ